METTLKPMKNEIDVIGRLKSLNLEEDTDRNGNERLRGDIVVLVEEKVDGELRSHEIRLGLYTRKYKANSNDVNFFYNKYKEALDEYKTIEETGDKKTADLVHVQGQLSLNEYIGQDGAKHSYNRFNGRFINRMTPEEVKKRKGPKATIKIEALVDNIKEVLDSDGLPTDDKKLHGFNVDFFGELRENSKPIVPFEAIVPGQLADVFDGLYSKGDTGKFTLKINNYAKEADQEEVEKEISGFGDVEELQDVVYDFVNNLEVIGGTEPYENGRELDEEQIQEVHNWRKAAERELEDGYVPNTDTPKEQNAFGEGSKKEVKNDLSEDELEELDF